MPKEPSQPNKQQLNINAILQGKASKVPTPVIQKKHKNKLAAKSAMLHTYRQDVEGLVKRRKVSLVNVVSMQSDSRNARRKGGPLVINTLASQRKKTAANKFMIMASFFLIVLGSVAVFAAYNAYQAQLQSALQDKKSALVDDTMIFVEHRARLNVTDRLPRETLSELAKILRASQATLGSITQILLEWSLWNNETSSKTTFTISQSQMLQVLGITLPEQFTRLLGNDSDYLIGMHMADRNTPFIILTTRSYEHAFAALLDWEQGAEAQLSPFFLTPGTGSGKRSMEDIVIQNIDARVSRDDVRNLKFLYAFLDRQTILITNNIHTLTEVSRRYKVRQASGTADIPPDFIR